MFVEGDKQIMRALDLIGKKEVAKAVRQATRETQKKIMLPAYKKEALALVGEGEGMSSLIAKNLKVRAMTKMKPGSYGAKVLILDDPAEFVYVSQTNKRYFIPAAIEYGHAFPGRGGFKGAPKDVPAKPFAQTAYESKRKEILTRTQRLIWAKLESSIRKLAAEGNK